MTMTRHFRGAVGIALSVAMAGSAAAQEAAAPGASASAPQQDGTTASAGQAPGDAAPAGAAPAPAAPPAVPAGTLPAAKLTPIVPSPRQHARPAFQLYAELDLPALGVGLVFAGARLVRLQTAYCAPLCTDKGALNVLDRTTAGYWSPNWQLGSDITLAALAAGSPLLLIADEGFLEGLNDTVVVAESALAGTGLASMLTLAANRPRPFLYGEKAPLSARQGPDASLSFVSSHATVAFAIATSTYMAVKRLHPHSILPALTLGIGGALAVFVGTARVMGGMHFISDSAGGAIIGTSLGVLIPSLHASAAPVRVVPMVSESQRGLGLLGTF